MQRYKIPKFLEREIKFFNLLTFKQLVILGSIALVLFVLYYIVPKSFFIFLAAITVLTVFSMVAIKVEGVPLPQFLIQSIGFFITSRKYFWQKKELPNPIVKPIKLKRGSEKEEEKEKGPLRISPGSRLNKLSSKIETGL
jgi:hypothetical protein